MEFTTKTISSNPSLAPLVHLLHDIHKYADQFGINSHHPDKDCLGTFFPNFDVVELDDCIDIYGELAGVSKNNISIEVNGPMSLSVSGWVQRSYDPMHSMPDKFTTATATGERGTEEPATAIQNQELAADDKPTQVCHVQESAQEREKKKANFLMRERNVGKFSRTFALPASIEPGNVSAHLDGGILHIRLSKDNVARQERRIEVS
ncbi:hypothetical protein PLICBS_004089 [Purpureocillium lilacinum]|uniref:uncharacterized protein n=1 Tax=Purpureocillium lilacinum TaxID=33203 RepID=UPI002088E4F9|nr:hypothetical protein PLICBS_004089 [Purpureocillium lilacinum]